MSRIRFCNLALFVAFCLSLAVFTPVVSARETMNGVQDQLVTRTRAGKEYAYDTLINLNGWDTVVTCDITYISKDGEKTVDEGKTYNIAAGKRIQIGSVGPNGEWRNIIVHFITVER